MVKVANAHVEKNFAPYCTSTNMGLEWLLLVACNEPDIAPGGKRSTLHNESQREEAVAPTRTFRRR